MVLLLAFFSLSSGLLCTVQAREVVQCCTWLHVGLAAGGGVLVGVVVVVVAVCLCSWRRNWTLPCYTPEKHQSGDPETGSGSPTRDQGRESQPQVAVALRRTPVKQGTPTLLPGRVRTRQELMNERTQDQNDDDSETVGHVTPASADTTRGLHIENTSTPCSSFATAASYGYLILDAETSLDPHNLPESVQEKSLDPRPLPTQEESSEEAVHEEAPYDVLQASDIGQMTPYDDLGIHQAQVSQTDVKELVTNQ